MHVCVSFSDVCERQYVETSIQRYLNTFVLRFVPFCLWSYASVQHEDSLDDRIRNYESHWHFGTIQCAFPTGLHQYASGVLICIGVFNVIMRYIMPRI